LFSLPRNPINPLISDFFIQPVTCHPFKASDTLISIPRIAGIDPTTICNMKYAALIICLALSSMMIHTHAFAQDESSRYDSITSIIKNALNAGHPDDIYNLTSSTFRARLTAEQFAIGMKKFLAKNGSWKTYTYKGSQEMGYDHVAQFEWATQLFSLKLNEQGSIDRMNFAVIVPEIAAKKVPVESNNPLSDSIDRRVEQLVRPYIQKGNTAGILLAVIDHGQIRRYSYGTVNKTISTLPDADKSIFEIGSVTKTFTALLLAQQVINGRMKLNDPVNRYLPDSIPPLVFRGDPVRIVHLANHTAGLPRLPDNIFQGKVNVQNPYQHYTPDSMYSFLAHYKMPRQPGTAFSYSNVGAGLLGTILEQQLQMSFDEMVVEKIAKPLHLSHTVVEIPAELKHSFVQGYNEMGLATSPWDLGPLKGSGAIRSTLNDMIIYTQAQMESKNPLKKAIALSHAITFDSSGNRMGLGWRINKTAQQTYYHHSGGTGGLRSFVGFDIKRQLGIVILSNAAEEVTAIGEILLKEK
jgi:CubicO group peptidase (beta-lactamase class C family)